MDIAANTTNSTDDAKWVSAAQSAAVILVGVLALLFGALVCATVYLRPRLRTVTNLLIVNLAVADILVTVVTVPSATVTLIAGRWTFGEFWCRAAGFSGVLFSGASIVTLAAISIERYYSTAHPRTRQRSVKRAGLLIAYVWLHATLFSFPPLVGLGSFQYSEGKKLCAINWLEPGAGQWYNMALVVGLFVVPLLVMTFAYIGIFWKMDERAKRLKQNADAGNAEQSSSEPCRLRGSTPSLCWVGIQGTSSRYRRSVRQLALEKRLAKTVLTVIGVFLICWLPYYSVNLWTAFTGKAAPSALDHITWLLAFVNSACNPIIYGLRNKKFRETFKAMLTCRRVSYAERRYSLSRSVSQSIPTTIGIGCGDGLKLPAKRKNSLDSGFVQLISFDCRRRSSLPGKSSSPSARVSASPPSGNSTQEPTSPPTKRPKMNEKPAVSGRRRRHSRRRTPVPGTEKNGCENSRVETSPSLPAFKLEVSTPWVTNSALSSRSVNEFDNEMRENSIAATPAESLNIVFGTYDESLV